MFSLSGDLLIQLFYLLIFFFESYFNLSLNALVFFILIFQLVLHQFRPLGGFFEIFYLFFFHDDGWNGSVLYLLDILHQLLILSGKGD